MHIPFFDKFFVTRYEYDLLYKQYINASKANLNSDREYYALQQELKKLEIKLIDTQTVPVAGFDTTDDEPSDPLARKQYIQDVDYFMDTVLNRKLKCSIADIREMLSNVSVARGLPQNMQRNEYDFFLRGMESFAWKIHEWGTLIQAERRSSLQDKENNNGSI